MHALQTYQQVQWPMKRSWALRLRSTRIRHPLP